MKDRQDADLDIMYLVFSGHWEMKSPSLEGSFSIIFGAPGPCDFLEKIRNAPDTFNFLRHVMRAIWAVRPKCSHRRVSLKETPLKPVQSLKHTTENSAEQTVMRTKWFKHIAI